MTKYKPEQVGKHANIKVKETPADKKPNKKSSGKALNEIVSVKAPNEKVSICLGVSQALKDSVAAAAKAEGLTVTGYIKNVLRKDLIRKGFL